MNFAIRLFSNTASKEKAICSLDKALQIAKRNPQTHEIIRNVENHPHYTNIVRNSGNSKRIATYDRRGKLRGITRYPYSGTCKIIDHLKGRFDIFESLTNPKSFLFNDFQSFIQYFRKALPVINGK